MTSVQCPYFISTFSVKVPRQVAEMFVILNVPLATVLFHFTVFSASMQYCIQNKNAWVKDIQDN